MLWWIVGSIVLLALILGGAYYAYRFTFAVLPKHKEEILPLPGGSEHDELRRRADALYLDAIERPCEMVTVTTHDGLRLVGRLYESNPAAPTFIMFHGYRSSGVHDYCGGMEMARELGCNALVVDQRAHGKSEGRCLTFGAKESRDVLPWCDFVRQRYGADVQIILTGISMGAATVMLATGLDLPANVAGVIADCGYSSPEAIIRKVARDIKMPQASIFFVRLGGLLFAGFDMNHYRVTDALQHAKVPVLFIHGEADDFVPCDMTRACYAACASEKYLLTVPDAGHGLSYLVDRDAYINAVQDFLQRVTIK